MRVRTDSERVRLSRRMVLEFLGSSVDMSLTGADVDRWQREYGADPRGTDRRPRRPRPESATHRHAGHHHEPTGETAETVAQPVKVDNDLYVRDYSRCILCYKCVEACGVDAQNTFAIAVAGRGFDARISTEFDVGLPGFRLRLLRQLHRRVPDRRPDVHERARHARGRHVGRGRTDRDRRRSVPYCGVGCELEVHVQDNSIVKVTSPSDHSVTSGHLCIKGRFGFEYVQNRPAGIEGSVWLTSPGSCWRGAPRRGSGATSSPSRTGDHRSCTTRSRASARSANAVVVVLAPAGDEPAMPAGVSVRFVRDPTDGGGPARRPARGAAGRPHGPRARRGRRHARPAALGPARDAPRRRTSRRSMPSRWRTAIVSGRSHASSASEPRRRTPRTRCCTRGGVRSAICSTRFGSR